ncbi:MAG: TlpA family protein disulfide reductase [Candidatus Cloacimonetes bacterium]|jgi:thiol-disulfide isomerase/thioredoxin|nr:TlpA family protein disulfide reductase [Candidatus Cloacimonadota bacterium]MCB5287601.1 TlpA family protein disulfide reductase [Candidatus Cloacimonadota bacterium]MCK9184560.1 TlpA family protein disulfide reductase [Candidatus Cloacimonadota bacterium]MCK9584759.1 TlpA family protein disulfide reductase [Candidatus Cloacimonadota bacterium]MDY0229923.1 TlpA disulfide reductase family protein [Candidatus Cloacimonadaceae bacterium]
MQQKWILATIAIVLISSLWAAPIDDFRQAFLANQDSPEVLEQLITEFKNQKLSLEDHRIFQSLWNHVNPQAVQAHYDELLKQNPQNPEYIYLSVRLKDNEEQMEAARMLIQYFPSFYWGYRIIAVSFTEILSQGDSEAYQSGPLFKNDLALIHNGQKQFAGDAYLNLAVFYAYKDSDHFQAAAAALDKVSDPQAISSNMRQIEEFCLKIHDLDMYTRLISAVLDDAQESGQMSSAEAELNSQYFIMNFLVKSNGITALDEYLANNPELKLNPDLSRIIAGLYLEKGRTESALDALGVYAASEDADYMYLKNSPEFSPLQDHPRWQTLLKKARKVWDKGANARKAEALKDRESTPAPLWELQDLQGKSHKLSELKGQIVILDFWASWCSPCKMAMPSLSRWMQDKMPQGVQVFSVNVMERELQNGKDYFSDQDFKMTYLEGTPEIATAYGVSGIPHFTIIDQAGNIAWSVVGFSYSFEESLNFQIEALKKN